MSPSSPEKHQYHVRLYRNVGGLSGLKFERHPDTEPTVLISAYDVLGLVLLRNAVHLGPGLKCIVFGEETDLPFSVIG